MLEEVRVPEEVDILCDRRRAVHALENCCGHARTSGVVGLGENKGHRSGIMMTPRSRGRGATELTREWVHCNMMHRNKVSPSVYDSRALEIKDTTMIR